MRYMVKYEIKTFLSSADDLSDLMNGLYLGMQQLDLQSLYLFLFYPMFVLSFGSLPFLFRKLQL